MCAHVCALCEQELAQDNRDILCSACQDRNRARVNRMVAIDEMWNAMHHVSSRIVKFQAAYPDAAALVERVRLVLAETLDPLAKISQEMHHTNNEVDMRLNTARRAK